MPPNRGGAVSVDLRRATWVADGVAAAFTLQGGEGGGAAVLNVDGLGGVLSVGSQAGQDDLHQPVSAREAGAVAV